jgi:hypothetical protein
VRAQVLHFVGPRKKVLGLVHKAFMAGGLEGAYRMLALLPHTEQELARLNLPIAEAMLLPQVTAAATGLSRYSLPAADALVLPRVASAA